MYLFTTINVLCYLFVLVISYFMIRGLINMLKLGKPSGLKPIIAALLLSPLSLWVLFQILGSVISFQPDRYFSSPDWKRFTQERYQLAADLIDRNLLIGKDTVSVKKILGDPWVRRNRNDLSWQWDYPMGVTSAGFGAAFNHLLLEVRNGVVISAKHHREFD